MALDLEDWIRQDIPSIILRCRHYCVLIMCGAIIMIGGDICPFTFPFRMSFEYWCLFYPAIVTLIFAAYGCFIFFRRSFEVKNSIPIFRILGFCALLVCLVQLVFIIVGTILFYGQVFVVGGVFFNPFVLIFLLLRYWCLVQGILIALVLRDAGIILESGGTDLDHYFRTDARPRGAGPLGSLRTLIARVRGKREPQSQTPYPPTSEIYAAQQPQFAPLAPAGSKMLLESKEETV